MTGAAPQALLEAIDFAAHKHRHQRRKDADGSPYINHPIAVARVLAVEAGITDVSTLLAAILHDTVEDTNTTFEELEAAFGAEVAGLVGELTDDKRLPKDERKALQVAHARDASPAAKSIKLADKICNVRDVHRNPPSNWVEDRRVEYLDWAERVVAGCRGAAPVLERIFDAELAAARVTLAG